MAELRAELEDPESAVAGGALARLYPPAFPDDPEAEAAYADLVLPTWWTRGGIAWRSWRRRSTRETLDDAQAAAWLGTLNDLRLVLGSSLGIEDGDDATVADRDDPEDPDAMREAVFAYLGWLVAAFVDALADALPRVPDEVA